MKAKPSTFVRG